MKIVYYVHQSKPHEEDAWKLFTRKTEKDMKKSGFLTDDDSVLFVPTDKESQVCKLPAD